MICQGWIRFSVASNSFRINGHLLNVINQFIQSWSSHSDSSETAFIQMFCNAISLWIGVTLWTLLKSNYTIYSLWACFNPSLCWLFLFRFSCHFHFWAIVRSASVINLRVRIVWAFWIIHMFCSKSPIYFPTLCFRLWLIHRFNSIDKNCMCCLESIAHSDTFCDHVNFSCAGYPVCVLCLCVYLFFYFKA